MKNFQLRWFRRVGLIEGLSLITLLFIAMPLKYMAGMDQVVSVVGMAHGVLYLLYMAFVFLVTLTVRWSWKWFIGASAVAFIPFGNFVLDARLKTADFAREEVDVAAVK
ncbi:DUF3817 domain-containing protein [Geomicrobium sp. JCM 19039]|uniref:DUF3817 domain-containing protein n=1 Tax=Geomicrobium sp. JCM 19039 TaxID=1460636 RepID=UPI00045F241C|nr:DUF3817 domain-containing protein [Geomicrobium sp. JCM 19039]GAK12429.1 hypothetical protein JCM19039_2201 [Geomicrobium sp. JCM 19039]